MLGDVKLTPNTLSWKQSCPRFEREHPLSAVKPQKNSGKVFMLDTNQDPTFLKFSPEPLDRSEKPLTNLVSYLPKQDLKKAELERTSSAAAAPWRW